MPRTSTVPEEERAIVLGPLLRELERQERDVVWLARKLQVTPESIHNYRRGTRRPSEQLVRRAYAVVDLPPPNRLPALADLRKGGGHGRPRRHLTKARDSPHHAA